MECPTPCRRCGEIEDLHHLRHAPNCNHNPGDSCSNLICPECYGVLLTEAVINCDADAEPDDGSENP